MLLGARQFFERRGAAVPTAQDYVQTGLIAMWDGIENSAWGTHSDSTDTWKDLIGGYDAKDSYKRNFGSWQDDGFLFPVSNNRDSFFHNGSLPVSGLSDWTYECVCKVGSGFLQAPRGIFGNMGSTSSSRGCCGFQYNGNTSWFGTYNGGDLLAVSSTLFTVGSTQSIVLVSDSSSGYYNIYSNGELFHRASGSHHTMNFDGVNIGGAYGYASGSYTGLEDGNYRRFVGVINALRVSNYAMSASDVARNYAIDKVRFYLP